MKKKKHDFVLPFTIYSKMDCPRCELVKKVCDVERLPYAFLVYPHDFDIAMVESAATRTVRAVPVVIDGNGDEVDPQKIIDFGKGA